jgi:hypothetical protein
MKKIEGERLRQTMTLRGDGTLLTEPFGGSRVTVYLVIPRRCGCNPRDERQERVETLRGSNISRGSAGVERPMKPFSQWLSPTEIPG